MNERIVIGGKEFKGLKLKHFRLFFCLCGLALVIWGAGYTYQIYRENETIREELIKIANDLELFRQVNGREPESINEIYDPESPHGTYRVKVYNFYWYFMCSEDNKTISAQKDLSPLHDPTRVIVYDISSGKFEKWSGDDYYEIYYYNSTD